MRYLFALLMSVASFVVLAQDEAKIRATITYDETPGYSRPENRTEMTYDKAGRLTSKALFVNLASRVATDWKLTHRRTIRRNEAGVVTKNTWENFYDDGNRELALEARNSNETLLNDDGVDIGYVWQQYYYSPQGDLERFAARRLTRSLDSNGCPTHEVEEATESTALEETSWVPVSHKNLVVDANCNVLSSEQFLGEDLTERFTGAYDAEDRPLLQMYEGSLQDSSGAHTSKRTNAYDSEGRKVLDHFEYNWPFGEEFTDALTITYYSETGWIDSLSITSQRNDEFTKIRGIRRYDTEGHLVELLFFDVLNPDSMVVLNHDQRFYEDGRIRSETAFWRNEEITTMTERIYAYTDFEKLSNTHTTVEVFENDRLIERYVNDEDRTYRCDQILESFAYSRAGLLISRQENFYHIPAICADARSDSDRLHLFPNPGSDRVQVWSDLPMNALVTIQLTNSHGQLVQPAIECMGPSASLDVSSLPPGIYHVSLITQDEVKTSVLLVE